MRSVLIAVIVLITIVVCVSKAKQLPTFIKKCKRDDPELNECMKRALTDIRVHIREGIRELKIPTFIPYVVSMASLTTGWMNGSLTNIRSYHSDTYVTDSIRIDFEKNPFIEVTYSLPYIDVKADYKVDGRILQLDLHRVGDLELRINNSRCTATIEGHKIRKNGNKEYMSIDRTDLKIVSAKLDHIRVGNLFGDELTDRFNRIIVDVQGGFLEELRPVFEEVLAATVSMLFKGAFDTFSLDELFD